MLIDGGSGGIGVTTARRLRGATIPRGRGRLSRLSQEEWAAVCHRLAHGESTSALARALGLAKRTVSERLSARVKTLKLLAIELLRAEFSDQIKDE